MYRITGIDNEIKLIRDSYEYVEYIRAKLGHDAADYLLDDNGNPRITDRDTPVEFKCPLHGECDYVYRQIEYWQSILHDSLNTLSEIYRSGGIKKSSMKVVAELIRSMNAEL